MAPRRRAAALLLILGLAACLPACASSQEWIYDKPRVTPAQVDRDKATCRKAAPSRSLFRTLQTEKVEREAFNRCMERLGYTVTVVPVP